MYRYTLVESMNGISYRKKIQAEYPVEGEAKQAFLKEKVEAERA